MTDKQSWWVAHRNALEASLCNFYHGYLAPVAKKVAAAAAPEVEAALVTAGKAVLQAAQGGTAHGSHEMIGVALDSLKASAPQLEATVSTALAASVVAQAQETAAQAADAVKAPA